MARWLYSWSLGSISFGGASLLVPLYIVQLGASPVQMGVLAATAAAIGAPGAILFGSLANRAERRRPLILVTIAMVALILTVLPLLTSITAIIVANAALWLVVASVAPVLTMLIVADTPESAWGERIGVLNKYQGYGWTGGLILGMVCLLAGNYFGEVIAITRGLFWVLAVCAGASAMDAARSLPRPTPDAHITSKPQIRKIAGLLVSSNRGIKTTTFPFSPNRLYWTTQRIRPRQILGRLSPALGLYLGAAGLFFTGSAAFWAPLPLFLTNIGFDSGQLFALYLISSLAAAILYEGAGRLASRYDVRLLQSSALAVRGGAFPGIALITGLGAASVEFGAAIIGLVAIGLTWAIIAIIGTAIVTRLAPVSVRGEVLGVYTALSALAGGVGGLLGGWTATFGYRVAFGVAGGLVLVGALLVFSLRTLSTGRRATDPPLNMAGDRTDGAAIPALTDRTDDTPNSSE